MLTFASARVMFGIVAVLGLGLLFFLLAAGLFFVQKGARRAGLVAALLPLAVLPLVAAVCVGSWELLDVFAGMAMTGSGGAAPVLAASRDVWFLTRVGAVCLALLGLVGLLGGLLRTGNDESALECSALRAATLLALPLAALLLTAGLVREQHRALHITRIVVEPKSASNDAFIESEFGRGSAAIAAVSSRISLATTLGGMGGFVAGVILLGLAVTGGILAWPVRVGIGFSAAAALIWLVGVAGGIAIALGLFAP
jgi:hypothetical protein